MERFSRSHRASQTYGYQIYTGIALILVALLSTAFLMTPAISAVNGPAPEFTHQGKQDWINSEPLTLKSLRGQVVLVDFWTFECWNCYRSFPWLKSIDKKYAKRGLTIIGVHSPEFQREHDRNRVVAKVKEFDLHHPVMIDNDFSFWRAMENQYWPAFYLIDKEGRIRDVVFGETHAGDGRAKHIEARIEELLKE